MEPGMVDDNNEKNSVYHFLLHPLSERLPPNGDIRERFYIYALLKL
jgi:hypothetical protein